MYHTLSKLLSFRQTSFLFVVVSWKAATRTRHRFYVEIYVNAFYMWSLMLSWLCLFNSCLASAGWNHIAHNNNNGNKCILASFRWLSFECNKHHAWQWFCCRPETAGNHICDFIFILPTWMQVLIAWILLSILLQTQNCQLFYTTKIVLKLQLSLACSWFGTAYVWTSATGIFSPRKNTQKALAWENM